MIRKEANWLVLVLAALLSGCASLDDPLGMNRDNRFAELAPEAPPPAYVGTWTGGTGVFLSTMKLDADGRGEFCSSVHARDGVGNLKFHDGYLYAQSGDRMTISKNGNVLILAFEDPKLPRYRLVPDPKLVEASPYCKKAVG